MVRYLCWLLFLSRSFMSRSERGGLILTRILVGNVFRAKQKSEAGWMSTSVDSRGVVCVKQHWALLLQKCCHGVSFLFSPRLLFKEAHDEHTGSVSNGLICL